MRIKAKQTKTVLIFLPSVECMGQWRIFSQAKGCSGFYDTKSRQKNNCSQRQSCENQKAVWQKISTMKMLKYYLEYVKKENLQLHNTKQSNYLKMIDT